MVMKGGIHFPESKKSMEEKKENIGCFGWVMRATGLMLVWKAGGCLMPWVALAMLLLMVRMCA